MGTSYALLVKDEEISTLEAAKLLGVSLDTVRAMIRSGALPARRTRPGPSGSYAVKVADAEKAREQRQQSMSLRAGPVQISDQDHERLVKARDAETAAGDAETAALARRAKLVERLGRLQRGTGAMVEALGVARSVVQGILRDADVPVVHHRYATPLTAKEVEQLRAAQQGIVDARARRDEARVAREDVTKQILSRGGYGVRVEVAKILGRHRGRLTSKPRRST